MPKAHISYQFANSASNKIWWNTFLFKVPVKQIIVGTSFFGSKTSVVDVNGDFL